MSAPTSSASDPVWLPIISDLKWPAVALLGFILLVLLFRAELREVLVSLKTRPVRWGSAELGAKPLEQQEAATQSVTVRGELAKEISAFEASDNSYLRSRTEDLHRYVNSFTFESKESEIRWLLREGAVVMLQLEFERTYRGIWQSQLELLQASNGQFGITLPNAKAFYADVVAAGPERHQGDTFERWYRYLAEQGLVQLEGETIRATPRGKLFLQYLIQQGYDLKGIYRGI